LINPLDESLQYFGFNFSDADTQRAIWRTTDGWKNSQTILNNDTFVDSKEPTNMHVATMLDPSRPWLLYVASNYLYRWDENTQAWSKHIGNQVLASYHVNALAVAPSDFNRIYTVSDSGEIWMTANAGSSDPSAVGWKEIDGGKFKNRGFTSLSVNSQDANDVLVGIEGGGGSRLWRSVNPLGAEWKDVANGLPSTPVNAIARDPSAPATNWYVGTRIGVFFTDDSGAHWYNATQPLGLPNVPIAEIKVKAGYLNVATYGRGIWRARLGCQPKSCSALGATCGRIDDGCGLMRDCGACPSGQVCGGSHANSCCAAQTCAVMGAQCGVQSDGCGGTVSCGTCTSGTTCQDGTCVAFCKPKVHCAPGQCGVISDDGCGRQLCCGNAVHCCTVD
jgi:hypothetical protein